MRDSAFVYYTRALQMFNKTSNWQKQANCYNNIAEIHWFGRRLSESLQAAEMALKISQEKLGEENAEEAFAYFNIATVYYHSGEYILSLEYFRKALPIQRKVVGDKHPSVAAGYHAIGYLYQSLGNLEEALEYFEKSLILRRQLLGEKHPRVIDSYTTIGIAYKNLSQPDLALEYHFKALAIVNEIWKGDHINRAMCYSNIGSTYGEMKDYDKALKYVLEACAIAKKLIGENNAEITYGYDNLASFYYALGDSSQAFAFLEKSLTTRRRVYSGEKHPEIAKSYRDLGDWYTDKKDYRNALESFQKSLVAIVFPFNDVATNKNPNVRDCQLKTEVLTSFQKKGSALASLYQREKNITYLTAALETYLVGDSLIDEARRTKYNYDDKLALGKITALLYNDAIEACMLLFKNSNDRKYLNQAFYFSEKSRAAALKEALAHTAALGMGLIPVEIQACEKKIKNEKSFLQSRITQAIDQAQDSIIVQSYKAKLFDVNRKSDSLMALMENKYPNYYELKYGTYATDIKTLQKKIPDHSAVIQFFQGNKKTYAFVITRDHFDVSSIVNDTSYHRILDQFRSSTNPPTESLDINTSENYNKFTYSSHQLYSLLLEKPLKRIAVKGKVTDLVIIPDGKLSYVPFDLLLTTPASSGAGNYTSLDYLMKAYTIVYAYSATLFIREDQKPKNTADDFLAFAPSYDIENTSTPALLALGKFRDAFTGLKWNQREAQAISDHIGGKYFLANEATETRFKNEAQNYRIIHLAMHAFADDENPMNSKLVFTNQNDTTDDGYLHAFELYNMQLNAEMVVLSACNTGYGKLAKGEGIMSVARAFAYAGVPSIVMSHWKVDDEATSKLMQYFYENLSEGQTKGEALRHAKLNYLANADPTMAHPFYWAAFVSVGDNSPVIQKRNYWLTSVVLISIGLLALFWYKKRK